jgi:hypothetical protein
MASIPRLNVNQIYGRNKTALSVCLTSKYPGYYAMHNENALLCARVLLNRKDINVNLVDVSNLDILPAALVCHGQV